MSKRISRGYRVSFPGTRSRGSFDTHKREAIRTARRGLRSLQNGKRAEVRTQEGALLWQGRKVDGEILEEEL
jgi:hypothetical protein